MNEKSLRIAAWCALAYEANHWIVLENLNPRIEANIGTHQPLVQIGARDEDGVISRGFANVYDVTPAFGDAA